MSDVQVNYAELGSVISAVNRISGNIEVVNNNLKLVSNQVDSVQSVLNRNTAELEDLRQKFIYMIDKQTKDAALQRALTEIVRIRQELEKKFGNQQKVRQIMIGILQAKDLNLVREKTISACSEQLMIECPQYWLAPCLIAITAWMNNDRDLAERALKEALVRNDENTSLVMALICRRAGKTDACFQWLQRYFNMQDPSDMKESILALIDAYANGIFGVDEVNMCNESVDSWMISLSERDSNFRQKQINSWKSRFDALKEQRLSDVAALEIKGVCPEYPAMYNYISRIRLRDKIWRFFNYIMSRTIDKKELKKQIDDNLLVLVNEYEENETSLRLEERRMSLIKEFAGDEKRADAVMASERHTDGQLNLADRLANAVTNNNTKPSIRKTSVKLMHNVIEKSFNEYMTEKAAAFPTEITLNIGSVIMKTKKGENKAELETAIRRKNEELKAAEIAKSKFTGSIVCGVIALILAIVAVIFIFAVQQVGYGVVAAIGAVILLIVMFVLLKKTKAKRRSILQKYLERETNLINLLGKALQERAKLCIEAEAFMASDKMNITLIPENEVKE